MPQGRALVSLTLSPAVHMENPVIDSRKVSIMLCTSSLWQPSSPGEHWYLIFSLWKIAGYFFLEVEAIGDRARRAFNLDGADWCFITGFEEQMILWSSYDSRFLHFLKKIRVCLLVWFQAAKRLCTISVKSCQITNEVLLKKKKGKN